MPKMKYWDGSKWIAMDAANADTVNGKSASDFAPATHIGEGGSSHALATLTSHGFLSKEDKGKLDKLIIDENSRVQDSNKLAGYTLSELDTRYGSAGHTHPNATTTTPGFMSANDKYNLDNLVANGGGGTTGTATDFKRGQNSIVLSADTTEVLHAIEGFDKDKHVLLVYQNSTFLQENVDYTFNIDGTGIVKSSGTWVSGMTIDFVAFLTTTLPTSDILTVAQYENVFTASGGESSAVIGIAEFDPAYDSLDVYHNNLRLNKTSQWAFSTDQTSVNFIGFTLDPGDTITFVAHEKIRDIYTGKTEVTNYSFTASNPDSNGMYLTTTYTRSDLTIYMESTLSNPDVNGYYQTLTVKYYASNGIDVIHTEIWTLEYDTSGQIISRMVS